MNVTPLLELDALAEQCDTARRQVNDQAAAIHDRIVRWQPRPYTPSPTRTTRRRYPRSHHR